MRYGFARRAEAVAELRGGDMAPEVSGTVKFYRGRESVLVVADIYGLGSVEGGSGFFGFHIHEGNSCQGVDFLDTGGHYNPEGVPHPWHAGDLPPLLLSGGGAHMAVECDRFRLEDVIGRCVVIHSGKDDFTSQPSGNAGEKIACGVIKRR